ncbi:MAG: ABC transporter permease [Sphaerochaetaceae bacterium]
MIKKNQDDIKKASNSRIEDAEDIAAKTMADTDVTMENDKAAEDDSVASVESFSQEDIAAGQVFLTPGQMVRRQFFRNRLAVAGIIVLAVIAVFCFLGPAFSKYTETEIFYIDEDTGMEVRMADLEDYPNAVLNTKAAPTKEHVLGTNEMGQDQLARLMYGGRISLMVGFVVVIVEMLLGVTLGGMAGYYGGWVDMVIMRLVEMFVSIPFIPLMLIISSLFLKMHLMI